MDESLDLDEATAKHIKRVLRITEEGENLTGMLTACYEHHISPGAEFVILKSGEDALQLRRADGKETFSLPAKYARHIRAESLSV